MGRQGKGELFSEPTSHNGHDTICDWRFQRRTVDREPSILLEAGLQLSMAETKCASTDKFSIVVVIDGRNRRLRFELPELRVHFGRNDATFP